MLTLSHANPMPTRSQRALVPLRGNGPHPRISHKLSVSVVCSWDRLYAWNVNREKLSREPSREKVGRGARPGEGSGAATAAEKARGHFSGLCAGGAHANAEHRRPSTATRSPRPGTRKARHRSRS